LNYPDWNIPKTHRVLHLLEKALLAHRVVSSSATGLPLAASARERTFKLLLLDIGLMQRLSGIDPAKVLFEENPLAIHRGALAEQFVGQQLRASLAAESDRLYYWSRRRKNATAEVDYLMVREGEIVPLEVKNGPAARLKSIDIFLREHPSCSQGIVLSSENVRIDTQHRLRFLPLYTHLP
jgi:hypothetical protein